MITYEFLEHTADVKFRAWGETPEDMLASAAQALFASMVDLSTVRAADSWRVELLAEDIEQLAYDWLSELIYLFEVEVAIFSKFDLKLDCSNGCRLEAVVWGERIDRKRHAFDCEVKAVTLHQFEVARDALWTLQAVLDV